MESSSSKKEVMKPIFYKAGIPLGITLAGFVIARIAARKPSLPEASLPVTPPESHVDIQETDDMSGDEQSYHSLVSPCLPCVEDDHDRVYTEARYEEEILGLRSRIEEFQEREWRLEKRFLCYQDLKDQEMALTELQNRLMLEVNRVEFLGRKISSLDTERERYAVVVLEYLKVLKQLNLSRSENEHRRARFKRLLRRNKEHVEILRKQCRQIVSKETEILEHKNQLEAKDDCIHELKLIAEQLQGERNDLLNRLTETEESATSKVEEVSVAFEHYNQLPYELEQQLQKDEAAEIEELIHLRWSNACLRHELMKMNQEHEQAEGSNKINGKFAEIEGLRSDNELNGCLAAQDRHRAHSKRHKLIAKLKKWVEGSEKGKEKEKNGDKCFRRRSSSDGAEVVYLPARNSSSSA